MSNTQYCVRYTVDGRSQETGVYYNRKDVEGAATRFRQWCRVVHVMTRETFADTWREVQS